MRLTAARIQKYRSIKDTGLFDVEKAKTILVGANEAGKSAILRALQQINPPDGVPKLNPLRDYPRSEYNDITTGAVNPADVTVAEAHFALEDDDLAELPAGFEGARYVYKRQMDNQTRHRIDGGPELAAYSTELQKNLARMAAHADKAPLEEGEEKPSDRLQALTSEWATDSILHSERSTELRAWLDSITAKVDEDNSTEDNRHSALMAMTQVATTKETALATLSGLLPLFVLFDNYDRVHPKIHLEHLADRQDQNLLDDEKYDYGNLCLMKLLGFTARGLSDLGKAPVPDPADNEALVQYQARLDERSYQLNAASVRLTKEIREVWNPVEGSTEADKLRLVVDGQYLKLVVDDDLGVEIELDQRSEGFQWLVSFFVVFFAETQGAHANAILLLDEPGLSLHGLKQREFRETISRLAKHNQTIYTTHSPFLVGPDELDLVRVVEMSDRTEGTQVHTTVSAGDSGALLPLQEALGYDLAQSLFAQQRNLVLEGLTDYWYLEATADLLNEEGLAALKDNIALVPASGAGKVVYFATILHAHKLKVAALLDSDAAGDAAAGQETLIHQLGNKNILRTKDAYKGQASRPEIEDMLRETLILVAKDDLGWDITAKADEQPERPIVDLFDAEIGDFSKYKLAKAYLRWTRDHKASDLTPEERGQWETLISTVNAALR
jgi:hypothetical protein